MSNRQILVVSRLIDSTSVLTKFFVTISLFRNISLNSILNATI